MKSPSRSSVSTREAYWDVHEGISNPEDLSGLIIDEFDVFIFELLHGFERSSTL